MRTSRAVVFDRYGPPEVLHVITRPVPGPGPGEVVVRVRAPGVQPVDCYLRGGRFAPPGEASPPEPQTLGNEFAGVVEAVGQGVADLAAGCAVLGWVTAAAYADHVAVPAGQVVRKPEGVSWCKAGVLSASGQTAHTALQMLGVGAGDTLLVHGGAGGVGTFAVQLARLWGARVIATASPENHRYLRELGAEPVAYGDGLVERARAIADGSVTAALDAVGGEALDVSLELVRDRSRIGTLVEFERAGKLGIRVLRSDRTRERLDELVKLHRQGLLRAHVFGVFPLEGAADAHRIQETRHVRGKLVLTTRPGAGGGE